MTTSQKISADKTRLNEITDARFRANPRYELVLFDRLAKAEQIALDGLQKDPEFYGILRPREQGELSVKSACQSTALLFYTLQDPMKLPHYVKMCLGKQCNQAVAELVLDGVIEIASGDIFLSGSAAYDLIYRPDTSATAGGAISQLSIQALQYAQALRIDDPRRLSSRIYLYNRLPLAPKWKRQFTAQRAVIDYLGFWRDVSTRSLLHEHWAQVKPTAPQAFWHSWIPRDETYQLKARRTGTFKLYISPRPESMPDALRVTIKVLAETCPCQFKFGVSLSGLLRPDKFVLYFPSFEELSQVAGKLEHELTGCEAQGVPFTAGIDSDGLLSWGIDPPRDEQTVAWRQRESWRLWIANQLAVALIMANADTSQSVAPWRFAMERLRLEGVDTDAWTPSQIAREDILLPREGNQHDNH